MYTFKIIEKNQFECNWITVYIGRKFKLISTLEVSNYTTEYLENNPDIENSDILELAWEQTEDNIDELLTKIASGSSSEVMTREYHKWLYCILKDIYITSSENMFEEIENVFSVFNTPENMYGFFRKVSDAFYYPSDSQLTIKELVEEFLEIEKKLILN